jgi:hypothetical protein
MSKLSAQRVAVVLSNVSPCLTTGASISGSAHSEGFAKLVGLFRSDVDTETASGLRIEQSADFGANWDYVSSSDLIAASTTTACSADVFGNAVKVTIISGGSSASALRTAWYLIPSQ